jgi:hypothetical protein
MHNIEGDFDLLLAQLGKDTQICLPKTSYLKDKEPAPLTYPDMDETTDNERYPEMQKQYAQWMNEVEGNRDLVIQILFQCVSGTPVSPL